MRHLEISDIIPAMRLPDVVFFPYTILPLYIFEPRYREMLDDVLEGDRMFTILNDLSQDHDPVDDNNRECVTLGCVRACQEYDDETALVLLEGLCRIDVAEYLEGKSYPRVRIRNRRIPQSDPFQLELLKDETLRVLGRIMKRGGKISEDVLNHLTGTELPQVFVDQAAASLLQNPGEKHRILQCRDPIQRYGALLKYLRQDLREIEEEDQIGRNHRGNGFRTN